jgi:gluconolactonase
LRTAFITLSGAGKLVAVDWPRPGLKLAWLND